MRIATMGKIHIILGCMFAGKTTALMGLADDCECSNIILVKHSADTRYGHDARLYTHSQQSKACVTTCSLETLYKMQSYIDSDVVFVDEGQFFKDLHVFCKEAAEVHGKDVHVAALNGDYKREPFDQVSKVLAIADDITMLNAICHRCNNAAHFSMLKSPENNAGVGGAETYEAVCRFHYTRYI